MNRDRAAQFGVLVLGCGFLCAYLFFIGSRPLTTMLYLLPTKIRTEPSLTFSSFTKSAPKSIARKTSLTAIAHPQPNFSHHPDDPSVASMELSNAEMQLFKADMEASKAEGLVARDEDALANCCIITAIAILCMGLIVGLFALTIKPRFH
jgi:hypothetical protein